MGILDGKVALVTGGGTLFGRAVVAELHRANRGSKESAVKVFSVLAGGNC